MVYRILCNFYSRSPGIRSRDIRTTPKRRWPGHRCLVLAHRILNGDVHRELGSGAGIRVPNGRWDVLCYQACSSTKPGGHLFMDSRMV